MPSDEDLEAQPAPEDLDVPDEDYMPPEDAEADDTVDDAEHDDE